MATSERVRSELGAAMSGATSARTAADQLCHACVGLLDVDGASVSLAFDGANRGTFGSSGELSRRLDELQFTYGEGPCLDAVRDGDPVLVPDLDDPSDTRWPALTRALLDAGVSAVFALPVTMSQRHVGALDLFAGVFKSFFFGAAIALISCHRGFHSRAGAEGVGRAATEAFVYSFIAILVLDFVIGLGWNTIYRAIWPNAAGLL